MKGKIKKVIRDRGFGFISSADGQEIFFHRSGLAGQDFDSLNEGTEVDFETQNSPKGLRAVNVKVNA